MQYSSFSLDPELVPSTAAQHAVGDQELYKLARHSMHNLQASDWVRYGILAAGLCWPSMWCIHSSTPSGTLTLFFQVTTPPSGGEFESVTNSGSGTVVLGPGLNTSSLRIAASRVGEVHAINVTANTLSYTGSG